MKKVRLGKTELEVTRVGFGGIPIQRLTEREAIRVVQRAMDLGVNFIDTANGYTTSEERIGKALAGRREQVILATKTGARDKERAAEHLELSLRRLQTSYIDIWQFHGVSSFENLERVLGPGGAMEAAQLALQAGKVRHIGMTSHSMDVALKAVPTGHFETLQFPFNFVTSEPAQELIPLCREQCWDRALVWPPASRLHRRQACGLVGQGLPAQLVLACAWLSPPPPPLSV